VQATLGVGDAEELARAQAQHAGAHHGLQRDAVDHGQDAAGTGGRCGALWLLQVAGTGGGARGLGRLWQRGPGRHCSRLLHAVGRRHPDILVTPARQQPEHGCSSSHQQCESEQGT